MQRSALSLIISSVLFQWCGSGQSKDSHTKTVRNACSLMVKISMQHSGLLGKHFDYVKLNVKRLSKTQNDSHLSWMEVVTLQEALLTILNY